MKLCVKHREPSRSASTVRKHEWITLAKPSTWRTGSQDRVSGYAEACCLVAAGRLAALRCLIAVCKVLGRRTAHLECHLNPNRGFPTRHAAHDALGGGGGSREGSRSFCCSEVALRCSCRSAAVRSQPAHALEAAAGSSCWHSRHSLVCSTSRGSRAARLQAFAAAELAIQCVLRPDRLSAT